MNSMRAQVQYHNFFIGFIALIMLFSRIYATFYKNYPNFSAQIIFTSNLVFLCQIISSTMPESLKLKYLFLAELLRFRYGIIFHLRTLYTECANKK